MYPVARDDGYDIVDFRHPPDYGTVEDFQKLVDAAHSGESGSLTELVVNHTSDQHPVPEARVAPETPAATGNLE
jgi:glycosidase